VITCLDIDSPCLPERRSPRALGLVSHSVIALAALSFAAFPATRARAQDAPVQLPPVNVEAQQPSDYKAEQSNSPKYTEPLVDTPKTITVIPKEVIEERGATSLTDVLRTVPGITLGAGEGGVASGDRAFIRGFDSRGDTFIDGARDFGVQIRDPFNLEQVEVIKGPNSAVSGRGSTGGSINLISKTARPENFAEGALTLGTDMTKRLTFDFNRAIDENTAFRLNLVGHDQDVAGRDAVEQQRWGIAPTLTLGLNTPTQLTLSYYHFETDGIPDYGLPFDPATGKPLAVDRENFYGLKARDFQDTQADIATVRLDHRFSDSVSLRNQFRYGNTSNDYVVTPPTLTGAPADQVVRQMRSRDENTETFINQTDVTLNFATGSIQHTVVTGIELSRENFTNQGRNNVNGPNANRFNPNPDDPSPVPVSFNGNNVDATTDTAAAYVFDTLKFGEQWQLSGGLRFDHVESDVTSGAPAQTFDSNDNLLSYNAGLVYKPAPNGSVYVSYGISYNTSAEFMSLNAETADLDPEKNKSYEVGTKWDLLGRQLSLTGAIFRTDKTNARVTDSLGDTVLAGETRVDGVEVGFQGNITNAWKVFGGYTYLKSEIVDDGPAASNDGKKVPGVAPHNFSLWTTYQVARDWTVGGGALYTGKRYANTANTQEAESYWRFDAMAAYQLTESVAFRLNLLNLTDETYFDGLQSGKAVVAPGRTLLFTTNVKF
jgi:catecholate siderophore receptor